MIGTAPTCLARIDELVGYFETVGGNLHALNGVTIPIEEGKVTGLVGETGSGKTIAALSLLRLWPNNFRYVSGSVSFRDVDVLALRDEQLRRYRGHKVSIAFQDPKASLNPLFTVGEQLGRVLRQHAPVSKEEAAAAVVDVLERVQIADPAGTAQLYAHELSGGMAQRVMIAMSVIYHPQLVILDEPTTGLDVTVQAEVIAMLRDLVEGSGMTVLLITHDLGVVGELCDKVAVMYAGHVMEYGDIADVFERPSNPYTRELLRATESVEGGVGDLYSIPGSVPDLRHVPPGCLFRARCPSAAQECFEMPASIEVSAGHWSTCHFAAGFQRRETPVRLHGIRG